ncbi:hypothetical protein BHM03_00053252, partial [Ensete ventricosum]
KEARGTLHRLSRATGAFLGGISKAPGADDDERRLASERPSPPLPPHSSSRRGRSMKPQEEITATRGVRRCAGPP